MMNDFYEECDNTYIIEDRQRESMLNRNLHHLVDLSTVCQFTGLKDENGKEVWEHDIFTSPYLQEKGEVIFSDGNFRVGKNDGSSYSFSVLPIMNGNLCDCSVIGNKFDRKEEEDD